MKYNQLGRTGLFVSEICLGAMTFGGDVDTKMWKAIGGLGQAETDEIIGRALGAGVNFIDTADMYAFGKSEQLVGQALKNLGVPRADIVIATKVGNGMGPQPNNRGASRGHIMDSVHGSLERLQTDHIDLYQIHRRTRSRRLKKPCARWTISRAMGWSAILAYRTGRPGKSPKRWD